MRLGTLLAVAVVVTLAGCSGLLGGDAETAAPEVDTPTAQTSATAEPSDSTGASTPTQSATAADGEAGATTVESRLREIVLSESELPEAYESSGQLVLSRDEATGDDAERFAERNLEFVVERTFTLPDEGGDDPEIVFSSAMRYENASTAESDLERIVAGLRDSGATVSEEAVTESVTATVAQFENEQGYRNTVYYGQRGDVVFYVVTSDGDRAYESRTEELFTQMVVGSTEN